MCSLASANPHPGPLPHLYTRHGVLNGHPNRSGPAPKPSSPSTQHPALALRQLYLLIAREDGCRVAKGLDSCHQLLLGCSPIPLQKQGGFRQVWRRPAGEAGEAAAGGTGGPGRALDPYAANACTQPRIDLHLQLSCERRSGGAAHLRAGASPRASRRALRPERRTHKTSLLLRE